MTSPVRLHSIILNTSVSERSLYAICTFLRRGYNNCFKHWKNSWMKYFKKKKSPKIGSIMSTKLLCLSLLYLFTLRIQSSTSRDIILVFKGFTNGIVSVHVVCYVNINRWRIVNKVSKILKELYKWNVRRSRFGMLKYFKFFLQLLYHIALLSIILDFELISVVYYISVQQYFLYKMLIFSWWVQSVGEENWNRRLPGLDFSGPTPLSWRTGRYRCSGWGGWNRKRPRTTGRK